MDKHPDLQNLPTMPTPAAEKLLMAKAQAIQWAVFLAALASMPVLVWLWRWAI